MEEFIKYLPAGAKILDAGCGAGRDTEWLRAAGFNAVGIDVSTELIKNARQQFPSANFTIGDLLSIPFEENTFDGIWAHAAVVHFETSEQIATCIEELHRVLKRDGILHLLVRANTGKKTEAKIDAISGGERFYWNFDETELDNLLSFRHFEIKKMMRYKESDLDPRKRPEDGIEWLLVLAIRK